MHYKNIHSSPKNTIQFYIGWLLFIAGGLFITHQYGQISILKKESKIIIAEWEENELESEQNSGLTFDFDVINHEIDYAVHIATYLDVLSNSFYTKGIESIPYTIALYIKICNFRL